MQQEDVEASILSFRWYV